MRVSKWRILYPKEYVMWSNMKQRCDNPKNPRYNDYGGRGITYDPHWKSFISFLNDLGTCPKHLSLDRIENDLGYTKENCRWATRKEQQNNQRLRIDNTSGVRGVWYEARRNHFVAEFNNKYIGSYSTVELAKQAYENYIITYNS